MFTSAFHFVKCNFQLILSPILGENYRVFLLLLDDSRTAPLDVKDATRRLRRLTSSILDIASCRLMERQQQKNNRKTKIRQVQFRLFCPFWGFFAFWVFSPTGRSRNASEGKYERLRGDQTQAEFSGGRLVWLVGFSVVDLPTVG